MTENENKIKEILAAFQIVDRIYKRQAVEEAIALKKEITPHLISMLEDVLARPEWYVEQADMSYIYAFMLLGYFKEPRAHRLMVDLFSLPEKVIDPLFGDLITEDLPMMLFRTSQGQVDDIKRLILNKAAYDYARSSAMVALSYAVIEEVISREEALEFLGSLFTGTEADKPDSEFWTFVASTIYHLYPEELMPVIEKAFANNMIETFFIGPEEYERALKKGKDRTLQELRDDFQRRTPHDLHKHMAWWAMFDQEEKSPARIPFSTLQSPSPPAKKVQSAQAKKKKKRKMAKASKKKNRR